MPVTPGGVRRRAAASRGTSDLLQKAGPEHETAIRVGVALDLVRVVSEGTFPLSFLRLKRTEGPLTFRSP